MTVIFQFRSDNLAERGIVEGSFIDLYRRKFPDLLNDGGAGNGIAPCSEAQKEAVRKANLGQKRSSETRKLISSYSKGRIPSKEARERMSASQRGRKLSQAHKDAIGRGHKGKKLTPEQAERCRKLRLGVPHTEEVKNKISAGGKGKKRTPEQIQRYRLAAQKRYADPVQRAKFDAARKLRHSKF